MVFGFRCRTWKELASRILNKKRMEKEVRIIPRDTVSGGRTVPRDLAKFTRDCFAPLGGVELELPPRGPMRKPPDFS